MILIAGTMARTTVNNVDNKACKQTKKTQLMLHIKGVTEDNIILMTTVYILTFPISLCYTVQNH